MHCDQVYIDSANQVVTSPAYMYNGQPHEGIAVSLIYTRIDNCSEKKNIQRFYYKIEKYSTLLLCSYCFSLLLSFFSSCSFSSVFIFLTSYFFLILFVHQYRIFFKYSED